MSENQVPVARADDVPLARTIDEPLLVEDVLLQPRAVQTVIAAIGLKLRSKVFDKLVDGTKPDARTAAITALLSESANLHQFDPEIPWTSSVIHRAKELENGNWGAAAAGAAITRATIAVISGALSASAAANAAGNS